MTRYIVYRSIAGPVLGQEDDGEPVFVFIKEDDIKVGLVEPRGNPNLRAEPEGEVEAATLAEAESLFRASRSDFF